VWSFGMVLYEIFTYGGVPFQGIPESGLRAHVLGKHTPKVPKSCTSKIVGRLMEATWALDAKRRPDAFEITTKLADAQVTALSDNKQTVRNIGKLAAGSVVSPYAALDTGHAQSVLLRTASVWPRHHFAVALAFPPCFHSYHHIGSFASTPIF
jgi:hypothetical protein